MIVDIPDMVESYITQNNMQICYDNRLKNPTPLLREKKSYVDVSDKVINEQSDVSTQAKQKQPKKSLWKQSSNKEHCPPKVSLDTKKVDALLEAVYRIEAKQSNELIELSNQLHNTAKKDF